MAGEGTTGADRAQNWAKNNLSPELVALAPVIQALKPFRARSSGSTLRIVQQASVLN